MIIQHFALWSINICVCVKWYPILLVYTVENNLRTECTWSYQVSKPLKSPQKMTTTPTTCFHNAHNCTMHLDRSLQPLEGNNQSSTKWDIINKLSCETVCHSRPCTKSSPWFTSLCSHWLTAVSQTSGREAAVVTPGQNRYLSNTENSWK